LEKSKELQSPSSPPPAPSPAPPPPTPASDSILPEEILLQTQLLFFLPLDTSSKLLDSSGSRFKPNRINSRRKIQSFSQLACHKLLLWMCLLGSKFQSSFLLFYFLFCFALQLHFTWSCSTQTPYFLPKIDTKKQKKKE
jgi:hypothetical protein